MAIATQSQILSEDILKRCEERAPLIADTLYISLNTVASHGRNILAQTGSTNRTEAAAYAIRSGIQQS